MLSALSCAASLDGRVVAITGASSGMGVAAAQRCAADGAKW
jgi:NAD(P)-dependent dehydrogenase (short-subunit alcohol dehydrogenase family)